MEAEPQTLQEAVIYFKDPTNCRNYLVARRWPNGIICPRCDSANVAFLPKYNRWYCREKHPAPQFTLKTGTIMEDSPIGLDKWMVAMWMVVSCKNGVSSYEVHRAIGVTQKTAWFMDHRIRLSLGMPTDEKLSGEIEADETFIGGKVGNMHRFSKRCIKAKNDKQWGKTAVLGLLQRDGQVRAAVAPSRHKRIVDANIIKHVEKGSKLYTDEFIAYEHLPEGYSREFINHVSTYVRGNVHTNGIENFWSLLKRTLRGTYVSVDPAHLFRYVEEQVFRYNYRKDMNDSDRFSLAVSQIVGKRLTYAEVTGKVGETVL